MFKIDTLGKKISLGFALVMLVLTSATLVTIRQVRQVRSYTGKLTNVRVPMATASLELMNGINHSSSALRGWLVMGNEKYIEERQVAWDVEIGGAVAVMDALAGDVDEP